MSNLSNLEPQNVFHWFYELNQIPRNSGHEQKVSDFLVKFAKDRNLEVHQDKFLNVIIKKPGTAGYETSDTVIIQGHMDMVCVKEDGCSHNFDTDPIDMIIDGDVVTANGTTLGADDGIAVAMGLALLDSSDIAHPPIEFLATTSEETGMDGAFGLTNEFLTGKHLINIDTETEGDILVSCSGGSSLDMHFEGRKESVEGEAVVVTVSGLKGGHSGMEIHKQRANAIKVTGRILNEVKENACIASISGGIKHNAIPALVTATVVLPNAEEGIRVMTEMAKDIKNEYRVEEPGMEVTFEKAEVKEAFDKAYSTRMINYIMMLPDGVQKMSKDIEGLVETSLNNAIIETKDDGINMITSIRSACVSSLKEMLDTLKIITEVSGGSSREFSSYPAWQFDAESRIRDIAIETYKELYKEEPNVTSIHAGLECGLLKGILPDTDMVSFGPDINGAHSPEETLGIKSTERVWAFTKELLKKLK